MQLSHLDPLGLSCFFLSVPLYLPSTLFAGFRISALVSSHSQVPLPTPPLSSHLLAGARFAHHRSGRRCLSLFLTSTALHGPSLVVSLFSCCFNRSNTARIHSFGLSRFASFFLIAHGSTSASPTTLHVRSTYQPLLAGNAVLQELCRSSCMEPSRLGRLLPATGAQLVNTPDACGALFAGPRRTSIAEAPGAHRLCPACCYSRPRCLLLLGRRQCSVCTTSSSYPPTSINTHRSLWIPSSLAQRYSALELVSHSTQQQYLLCTLCQPPLRILQRGFQS